MLTSKFEYQIIGMSYSLINKYNVAGPRYTSYPTVPYWDMDTFSLKKWKSSLQQSFKESNTSEGLSLYLHLPFCASAVLRKSMYLLWLP